MTVRIDPSRCRGCGLCAEVAPGIFGMKDTLAIVLQAVVDRDREVDAAAAAEDCPWQAIMTNDQSAEAVQPDQ